MDTLFSIFDWIYIPAIIVSLITSFLHRHKKHLFPIQLYIIISLVVNIIIKITDFIPRTSLIVTINNVVLNIYSIVEIALLYYFIYGILKSRKFRLILIIFFIIYLSIYVSIWISTQKPFFLTEGPPFGFENLLLTIPCFFIMYEFMISDLVFDFKSDANFIITCGILFYFSITTPFYFGYSAMERIAPGFFKIFSILNFTFYALLFISFTKAYLCPLPEQKS